MKRKPWVIATLVLALLLGAGAIYARFAGRQPLRAQIAAALAAPADTTGYAHADGTRKLSFPADFGAHDDYLSEWWYYTGNLTTSGGEHFGYQLTIFRRALVPPERAASRSSAWGTDQVYMAHLALTDVSGGQHYAYERFERGAAGLAGATAEPYRVWLDGWSVQAQADGAIRLAAAEGDVGLNLELRNLKGPVLQGDAGYSRKGPGSGNASYYYSFTRIATQGQLTVRGRTYTVDGLSWMDHEFSTSALSSDEAGWDWFSVQLAGGRELMIVQIRMSDGSPSPFSAGTLIEADGISRPLSKEDFAIDVTGHWQSPHDGAVYPSGWRLRIPSAGLDLGVTPYIQDQEMDLSYRYWEGSVRVEGNGASGSGYVELTGYGGSVKGQF